MFYQKLILSFYRIKELKFFGTIIETFSTDVIIAFLIAYFRNHMRFSMAQYEAKPRGVFDQGETVIWKRCRRRSVLVPTKMMFHVPASEEKKSNGPNMKQTNMKLSVKGNGCLPSLLLNIMVPSVLSWADQPANERFLVELIMRESYLCPNW